MTSRALTRLPLALLLLSLLTGCAVLSGEDSLNGTQWILSGIDGAAPLAGQLPTLAFEDGGVRGSSGCNTFGGSYDVRGESLTISDLMATEMACLEPERMEQESAYFAILADVTSFSLSDGRLVLSAPDGRGLTFTPEP